MQRIHIYIIVILGLLLALGCQEKTADEVPPVDGPTLVSVDPEPYAKDIKGDNLTIILTFDQNIKCPLSQHSLITIDGNATIENINAYMMDLTIKVSGLESGSTYAVKIPEGTVQGYRVNQKGCDEIIYSFSTKADEVFPDYILNPVESLVNPNATQQAKNLYNFLLAKQGEKILSGIQSNASSTNDMVNLVYEKTGKHPALAGYDYIFLQYSPTPPSWSWKQDYTDISDIKEHWDNNGVVAYTWHWNVPNSTEAWDKGLNEGNFDGYAFYTSATTFDINEALKPGTWQNDFIMKDIEEVAGYLKLLQDEGIPVLWRPLHEAAGNYDIYGGNGAWFWWGKGGAEPCKALWKLLYDQLVGVYGLNNLIWVWTCDVTKGAEEQYDDWYPGNEYVDIVGVDIYEDNTNAKSRQHKALVDLTKGKKLITVSECGNIPDPTESSRLEHKWSWFMVWSSSDAEGNPSLYHDSWSLNTEAYWKQVMTHPHILTREDMPSLK